jgi:Ca2+-binding RTX toxin-like protein
MIVLGIALCCAALVSLAAAVTASNTVPATNLLTQQADPSLTDMAPAECSSMVLTALLTGNGSLNGTNADELILGGPAGQTLKGKNGDDCILGGGGNDDLQGGNGTDVCLGQGGADTFNGCETQVQ